MRKEGKKGDIKPQPITYTLDRSEILVLRDVATQREKYRGYKSGTGWKKGINPDAVFIGCCGEYVTHLFLESSWDTSPRKSGDNGFDITIAGEPWQIKTRSRPLQYSLIRATNERGKVVPINFVYMIACEMDMESHAVDIIGYCPNSVVRKIKPVQSRHGNWFNYKVPDSILSSASDMKLLANSLRGRY